MNSTSSIWKKQQSVNCLLTKDDIGKAKPSARDLPQGGFTFGKADPKEQFPVGILTSSWNFHAKSSKKISDKDFQRLNKVAIKEKAHTSQRQYELRKMVDIRIMQAQGTQNYPIKLPQEEFIYGKPNRPSTPIKDVVTNFYGDVGEQQALLRR